jgi:hypothetical protein
MVEMYGKFDMTANFQSSDFRVTQVPFSLQNTAFGYLRIYHCDIKNDFEK